ncbi:MAG: tetratricopeptide repeat protein [Planctomycetia bacterium]|nr:tetratricopeptide repeat protein [Planctomycetia bacterium]
MADEPETPGPPFAEVAYAFRHAMAREAVYQLQLPGDRERLHGLALEAIERGFGGRPAAEGGHASDAVAEELAAHAAGAGQDGVRRLYLARAARHAAAMYRDEAAERLWRAHAELCEGVQRADSTAEAATAAAHAGRPRAAVELWEDAIALFRAGGVRHREAGAVTQLGFVLLELGDVEGARRRFDEALALQRADGDRLAATASQNGQAVLLRMTGRVREAEAILREVLATHGELGDRENEAKALANLSGLLQESGRTDQAVEAATKALDAFVERGDRRSAGIAWGNLAVMHSTADRRTDAERAFEAALAIHRETGNRRSEATTLMNFGAHLMNTDRPAESERLLVAAIALHREVDNGRMLGAALGNLGSLLLERGERARGLAAVEEALATHRRFQNRRSEGIVLCERAVFHVREGRLDEARADWRRGTDLLREVGDSGSLVRKRETMAKACADAGVEPFDGAG